MPLRLDMEKKLVHRSDRVKCVELHPTEAWLLASLYSGNIFLWNVRTMELAKTFEATEMPVRTAKFVPQKQWIVCGADDMMIRAYNYNTTELVKAFEAHSDYIRCIAVHPSAPHFLTSSDDMLIKMWDWDKNFACTQVFEGHSHYVMQIVFNPKDPNTFASASLDRTVKVWSLGQPVPNFTLEGHEKGVNCVDYFAGSDRPYLVTGADDASVRVWDYQTKGCVQAMEGYHTHNVSSVAFHPDLPLIISASEDGSVRLWHSTTYRLEQTLNFGLERAWTVSVLRGTTSVAMGFDEGTILCKLGREEPVVSMDSSGKVIYAKQNEVRSTSVKALPPGHEPTDGERLPLQVKDLGSTDLYPQQLSHSPNGRFVAACGDGEFVIYTALAWRSKAFGQALDFAWGADSSSFAVRESPSKIKLYKGFKEHRAFHPSFGPERIFGGSLLGVKGSGFIVFFDWQSVQPIRRIDVEVSGVHWSESGEHVCIITEDSFYILRYNRDSVQEALASNGDVDEGVEEAFEPLHEVQDPVSTATWVGDCFIYTTPEGKLAYCIGGEVETLYHLDRPMFVLGYLATQNRVYLIDKDMFITSYTLLLSVVEAKTLVIRGDFEQAERAIESVPEGQKDEIARFLHQRGMSSDALRVGQDPSFRFQLALELGRLPLAKEMADLSPSPGPKLRQVGQAALTAGNLSLAEECLFSGQDFSGLLMLYTAQGNREGLEKLACMSSSSGKQNVAFTSMFLLNRPADCCRLMESSGRLPEAAFFARSYCPSLLSDILARWQSSLRSSNPRAADSLADPASYPNLFPEFDLSLEAENISSSLPFPPASSYASRSSAPDPVEEAKKRHRPGEQPDANGTPSSSLPKETVSPTTTDAAATPEAHSVSTAGGGHSPQPAAPVLSNEAEKEVDEEQEGGVHEPSMRVAQEGEEEEHEPDHEHHAEPEGQKVTRGEHEGEGVNMQDAFAEPEGESFDDAELGNDEFDFGDDDGFGMAEGDDDDYPDWPDIRFDDRFRDSCHDD